MSDRVRSLGARIDLEKVDVVGSVERALAIGHAVLSETMWHTTREQRVAGLLKMPIFDDMTLRVGYGRGNTADQALLRCVYTYQMEKSREFVDPDELPESSVSPLSITGAPTQLDFIVGQGDLRIHQGADSVIVSSLRDYDVGGGVFQGEGAGLREAVRNLADSYPFPQRQMKRLPVTLLWDDVH